MTDALAVRLVRLTAAVTFALLGTLSVLRVLSFKAHVHDLALISQSLSSLGRGGLLETSINPAFGMPPSYLGNHFAPSLAAFGPILWIARDPVALVLTQALVLSLAPLVLYRIARAHVRPGPALAVSLAYVLQPAFWFAGLYDFHQETSVATLGLVAWWLLSAARPRALVALLVFIAGLKETMPLWVAGFGLAAALRGHRRLGLCVFALAIAYWVLVLTVLMPALSPTGTLSILERRFPHLGRTPAEALATAITRPWVLLGAMADARNGVYLLSLLAPWLLLLPLASPVPLLPALPVLAVHLSSRLEITRDIGFYHHDSVLPMLAIASIETLSRLGPRLRGRLAPLLAVNALLWHVITASAYLPEYRAPLSPWAVHADFALTAHHRALWPVAAQVGPTSRLVTSAHLACFFADRPVLTPFPRGLDRADEVLVDLVNPFAHRKVERLFWLEWALQEPSGGAPEVFRALVRLAGGPTFGLVAEGEGYFLFRRGAPSRPLSGFLDALARVKEEWLALEGRGYGSGGRPYTP